MFHHEIMRSQCYSLLQCQNVGNLRYYLVHVDTTQIEIEARLHHGESTLEDVPTSTQGFKGNWCEEREN